MILPLMSTGGFIATNRTKSTAYATADSFFNNWHGHRYISRDQDQQQGNNMLNQKLTFAAIIPVCICTAGYFAPTATQQIPVEQVPMAQEEVAPIEGPINSILEYKEVPAADLPAPADSAPVQIDRPVPVPPVPEWSTPAAPTPPAPTQIEPTTAQSTSAGLANRFRGEGFTIGGENGIKAGGGDGLRFGPPRAGVQYGGGQGVRYGTENIGVKYGGGEGVRYGTKNIGIQYGGGQILRWGTPNAGIKIGGGEGF